MSFPLGEARYGALACGVCDVTWANVPWARSPLRLVAWADGAQVHVLWHAHDQVSTSKLTLGSTEGSLSTVATYFAPEPSMLYVAAKQSSELLVWAVTVTAPGHLSVFRSFGAFPSVISYSWSPARASLLVNDTSNVRELSFSSGEVKQVDVMPSTGQRVRRCCWGGSNDSVCFVICSGQYSCLHRDSEVWRCAHTGLLSDCPPTSAIPIISGSAVAVLGVENAGFLVALEFPVEVGVASGGGSTQVRTAPDGPPSLANLMNIGLTLQSQAESEAATARDVCGGDPSAQLMLVGPTPSDSFHALASLPLPTVRVPDLISFHRASGTVAVSSSRIVGPIVIASLQSRSISLSATISLPDGYIPRSLQLHGSGSPSLHFVVVLRPEGPRFSALGRSKYIVELWDGSVRDMAKPVTRTSAESAVVPPGVSEDIPVIVAAKSSVPKSVLEALQMIDMPDEEDDISGEPVTNPAACGPAGRPATTTLDSLLQSAASVGTALTRVQAKLRSTESTLERNALLSIAAHCVQTQCSLAWLMAELTDREEYTMSLGKFSYPMRAHREDKSGALDGSLLEVAAVASSVSASMEQLLHGLREAEKRTSIEASLPSHQKSIPSYPSTSRSSSNFQKFQPPSLPESPKFRHDDPSLLSRQYVMRPARALASKPRSPLFRGSSASAQSDAVRSEVDQIDPAHQHLKLRTEAVTLRETNEKLRSAIYSLSNQLSEKAAQVEKLEAEAVSAAGARDALQSKASALESRVTELEAQQQVLQAEIDRLGKAKPDGSAGPQQLDPVSSVAYQELASKYFAALESNTRLLARLDLLQDRASSPPVSPAVQGDAIRLVRQLMQDLHAAHSVIAEMESERKIVKVSPAKMSPIRSPRQSQEALLRRVEILEQERSSMMVEVNQCRSALAEADRNITGLLSVVGEYERRQHRTPKSDPQPSPTSVGTGTGSPMSLYGSKFDM